jgi:hypothetical protein
MLGATGSAGFRMVFGNARYQQLTAKIIRVTQQVFSRWWALWSCPMQAIPG